MKRKKYMRFILLLGVLAVAALALALVPTSARAQDQDIDEDGFLYSDEVGGCLLPSGMAPPCYPVDPEKPDLFVIFETWGGEAPWADPVNMLGLIRESQANGGLGVRVHVIDGVYKQDSTGRVITDTVPPQLGVSLTEDTLTSTGNVLGYCQDGTPNQEDDCTVVTRRIETIIKNICGKYYWTEDCKDDSEPDALWGQDLLDRYIAWVMLHEVAHSMTLAICERPEYNGRHYAPESGWIMDQAVVYDRLQGGKKFVFHIPDKFNPESQEGFDLVEETDTVTCEVVDEGRKKPRH